MGMFPIIVGGVCGGAAVLALAMRQRAKLCPKCGAQLPKLRRPANADQALWGGWTCLKCGTQVDRNGNLKV